MIGGFRIQHPLGKLHSNLSHDCFMIIPTLFLYFLPFCYPYILLHFMLFITCSNK